MAQKTWQEVAKFAQDFRDKSIAEIQPPVPDVPSDLPLNVSTLPRTLLSEAEVKITETAPENLIASLASGELTSTEVTKAFLRRAGLAQKLVGMVVHGVVALHG
jgi:amidase